MPRIIPPGRHRVLILPPDDAQLFAVFGAVSNVGRRPTFDAGERIVCESHLLDFEAEAYGRRIEVSFLERLRPEQRFPSGDALRKQIAADVDQTRRRLEGS